MSTKPEIFELSSEDILNIYENSLTGILIYRDRKIIYANRLLSKMAGIPLSKITGINILDFVDPRHRDQVESIIKRREAGEIFSIKYETTLLDGYGKRKEVEISSTPITIQGKPAILSFINDISHLKRAQRRLSTILQDQTELIARFSKDGTLRFVNEAYCRFRGKTEKELLGTHFSADIYEEDIPQVMKAIEGLSIEKPIAKNLNRSVDHQGNVLWIEWTNRALLNEHNEIVAYQTVGRDVTDRKQIEESVRELFDTQARLFSEIAHSLKTPFSVMLGAINRIPQVKGKELKELLNNFKENIYLASDQVSHLLKIAQLDLLPHNVQLETIEDVEEKLNGIVEKARFLFLGSYPELGFKAANEYITCDFTDQPVTLRIDLMQLQEVILMLVDNALLHATEDKKKPPRIHLTSRVQGACFILELQDDGIGIDKKLLDEIFAEEKSEQRISKRRGIGLKLSKRLVESQGGMFSITSSPKKGTTCTMRFKNQSQSAENFLRSSKSPCADE